ncbi:DUF1360 domain-containing protein [Haloactinomyces albus]|uniref:DUF1360 domain-containing protein n=1 Tax=Haloactinomyces albus TaxID=1352928 RepID=A0AAE4CQ11_9ACTN|nr:DUF1360 domain-containing protein [Haloactinomyces albus]MDR7302188.1 hypothetical protein [Haloactinomyces albus]
MKLLRRGAQAFREWFARQRAEYSGEAPRPITGYSISLATYLVGASGAAGAARATGRPSPRLGVGDLALMTLATHKISRSLAKDPITSPLRMPFTRFEGASAPSELHEEVRAPGAEHAIGELVSCPFCLAPWVASGLFAGHTFAPGATRAVGTIYASVAGADFLQYAYAALQQRSTPPEKR